MSSEKVIKVNPELFKIPITNKTQKNIEKRIKIKGNKTLKNTINKNILNHVRTKQNELFNTIIENSRNNDNKPTNNTFQSDFDKAVQHMDSLVQKPQSPSNKTIKNKSININNYNSDNLINETVVSMSSPPSIHISRTTPPPYGCLRGGSLPTYRSWKKNNQSIVPPQPISVQCPIPQSSIQKTSPDVIKNMNETQQLFEKNVKKKILTKQPSKQKKTLKRKFNVGRSKYYPKIGVLISNRTIRRQIVQTTQTIKQTPIHEIRKELIKKGLIKVGSNAPNDVLRKIYESISLLVGDVQNHNIETILHNYIHDK